MGGEYEVLVSQRVNSFIENLDGKSERIVRENLQKLSKPYPGDGQGDKKRLVHDGDELYRLHIGRTWTAFYDIQDGEAVVRVLEIMGIDAAHKKYGDLS